MKTEEEIREEVKMTQKQQNIARLFNKQMRYFELEHYIKALLWVLGEENEVD